MSEWLGVLALFDSWVTVSLWSPYLHKSGGRGSGPVALQKSNRVAAPRDVCDMRVCNGGGHTRVHIHTEPSVVRVITARSHQSPTSGPSAVTAPQIQLPAQLSNQASASNFTGENDYVIISTLLQTPF